MELQWKPALRNFATDTSLLRTLVRTTDTCFLQNTAIEYIQLGDMDDNVERFELSDGSFFVLFCLIDITVIT